MKRPLRDKDFSVMIDKDAHGLKKARKEKSGFLHHASVLGMGGWLLALPIVAGAYLGNYLDERSDTGVSWSVTFILLGTAAGVFNVWKFLYKD